MKQDGTTRESGDLGELARFLQPLADMPALQLVTSHLGADLDGLASMVALSYLEGPLTLALPAGMDESTSRFWAEHGDALPPLMPRRALHRALAEQRLARLEVVDTSRAARIGWLGDWVGRFEQVRAWDTHPGTALDLPRAALRDAASTTAPLVLLLVERGFVPSPIEAGLFLLGIHADSGHFTFETTTAIDLEAAMWCLRWGAEPSLVRRFLPRGLDRRRLALVTRMAEQAELLAVGGRQIALTSLELDGPEPDLATLLEELQTAEGWPGAFLVALEPDRVNVIGRAGPDVDLRPVLQVFGGGGHRGAGSATLHGWTLAEVQQRLVEALQATARCAADLATDAVHGIPATAPVSDAADALHALRINALPVHQDGSWVGLVSRREVDDAVRKRLGDAPVGTISTGPPLWVAPDADLQTVRKRLLGGQGRLVLVGQKPHAQGVITRTTFFRVASEDSPLAESGRPPKPDGLWRRATAVLGPAAALLTTLGELATDGDQRAWLVGGSVRDLLLGHAPQDLDVVVSGDAIALAQAAADAHGGAVVAHDAFGTATWTTAEGIAVDLARCRAESYPEAGALPRVVAGSLRQDLHRRDFTLNAMALGIGRHELGVLQDPFGGRVDLEHQALRVLHGLSFHDDPSRAIRAARFAARFDLRLAPGTQALLRQALDAHVLTNLGLERQGDAWSLLLQEREAVRAVALARDWGVLDSLHISLRGDRDLLGRLATTREAWARLSALAPDLEGTREGPLWIALGWAIPTEHRRERVRLRATTPGGGRQWVAGPGQVREARKRLRKADTPSARGRILAPLSIAELAVLVAVGPEGTRALVEHWVREGRHVTSAVDGAALMSWGVHEGPAVGRGLAAALAAARDGQDPDAQRAAALAAAG